MFAAPGVWRPRSAVRPLMLALCLTLTLAGCAPAATSSGARSATPQPTATAAPRILYQADWRQRASEWTLPPHWSIVNGALQNDGASSSVIALSVPYAITSQRYTLTVQMRALAAKGPGVSNMYGILGQTPSGEMLYTAALTDVEHSLHSYALVYPATPDTAGGNAFGTYDFTPGISVRPYVVQADGSYLSFTAGNGLIGAVKSAIPLAPVRFVIVDQNVELIVESLTISMP